MSTNALAFLLLNKFRNGAKIEELILALDELRNDLAFVRRDLGFSGDSIDVILYAVCRALFCFNTHNTISLF